MNSIILPKSTLLGLICLFSVIYPLISTANISQFQLDNGLKILIKEDHRAPIFIMQTWYDVGASNEILGITGISHLLEHMMFKGTKKYKAGEFSKIIAKNGGQDNAFTSKDYTAYYQKMPTSKLKIAIELEADRMQNLQLKQKDFESERQVVIEERRLRVEDKPTAKLYEQLRLSTFANNGAYHYPVIGLMNDIQTMPLKALDKWYRDYYQPNNAVIVIVGDVVPDKVYQLIKQQFAAIPSKPVNKRQVPAKPILAQSISLTLAVQLPRVALSFSVPSLASVASQASINKTNTHQTQAYTLEVIAYILNGNDNAWFDKTLIREKQLVSSISIHYSLYDKYQTNFIVSFTPNKGVQIETIKAEIWVQLQRLKTQTLAKKTLKHIQAQTQAAYIYEQDSIDTQAYYLGALETIGLGFEVADDYVDAIARINNQHIQTVAKTYFTKKNLSQAILYPKNP